MQVLCADVGIVESLRVVVSTLERHCKMFFGCLWLFTYGKGLCWCGKKGACVSCCDGSCVLEIANV